MPRKSKKINIRLVAEEAGVSLASVSRVLNNHPDVSEALRRQVMAVVEKNNFSPDKSVERLLRISVIVGVGDITDYIATILTGMGLAANAEGIELSIQRYTGRLPLLRVCRIWRCNAVAVISGAAWLDEVSTLAAAGIPCMLVGTPLEGERIGYFCTDSYHAMLQMLKYVHSQGHRRIAYLCAEPPNQSYQERVRAYREFMAAIGESADRFLVPPCPIGHIDGIGRDKEAGYQQTVQFLKGQGRATAFVCANDEIAFGCYKACFDNGLRIPEDISVAGCDDQSFARYLSPGLTTIRLPLISRGKQAIHCLSDYLRGKQPELPREYLLPELVIRSSVAAPPDA